MARLSIDNTAKQKLLSALALLLPTAVSILLLSIRNHLWDGSFRNFVNDSRTAVQVIVQILSFVLAMLQIYALRQLFALATRLVLPKRTLSMETLSWWTAISQTKMDSSLPMSYLICTITIVVLTALPSALWAGALTPILSTDLQTNGTIAVPQFTADSMRIWATQFQVRPNGDDLQVWNVLDNCTQIYDLRGFVPTCPVPALQGLLLTSASSATSNSIDEPRLHPKLDNVRWAYSGRSFGVGSSAAIAVPSFGTGEDSASLVAYQYHESGYNVQVECQKNSSSDIQLGMLETDDSGFTWYVLWGSLANEPPGTVEWYGIPSWDSDPKILTWAARSYEGDNMVTIAASENTFAKFNQTQCSIIFTPMNFNITINVTSKLIMVEKATNQIEVQDIDATGSLIFATVQSINLLARMSNSLYVSVMGNTLQSNVDNMRIRMGKPATGDTSVLSAAVADSFTAMLDDILVAYGSSQLLNSKDTKNIAVTGFKHAVHVGKPIWIYTNMVFNTLLVLAYLEELVRTRFWRSLSRFDYTNIKCTIAAASAGGVGIAEQVTRASDRGDDNNGESKPRQWSGSPDDSAFKQVHVVFDEGLTASTAKGMEGVGMPSLRTVGGSSSLAPLLLGSSKQEGFSDSLLPTP